MWVGPLNPWKDRTGQENRHIRTGGQAHQAATRHLYCISPAQQRPTPANFTIMLTSIFCSLYSTAVFSPRSTLPAKMQCSNSNNSGWWAEALQSQITNWKCNLCHKTILFTLVAPSYSWLVMCDTLDISLGSPLKCLDVLVKIFSVPRMQDC